MAFVEFELSVLQDPAELSACVLPVMREPNLLLSELNLLKVLLHMYHGSNAILDSSRRHDASLLQSLRC